ncbi:diguanylate cyclase [bacterium]|nr:diguanylate cyclase [bacterium]
MTNKVLLVDDSKTQLDVMKLRLSKCGFEVETSENALDGYNKIFTFVPDIILSDIVMPDLDGYQFCRLLKNNKITKNIPIILLTVLDKKLDEFWGKKAGAQAFISKTADFEEIKAKIDELIENTELSDEDKKVIQECKSEQISVKEQINGILNELLKQSIFLNEFRNLGEFYTHEKVLVEKCFDLFSTFIDYDIAGLFFNIKDEKAKQHLYVDIKNSSASPFVLEKVKRDFFAQMPQVSRSENTVLTYEVVRENQNADEKIISPNSLKTIHIIPFVFEGVLLGGVAFCSKNETDYNEFPFYESFKNELSALLKMKYLYSEVEILSVTDGLTGLYNRRHFEYNIEREFLRAKRYKNDLSLAILDIDFFKTVNDTHGHQYGDYVLREVANLMRDSFRKTDMLYRYGGEELVIIMPETSLENAAIPAERLREKIAGNDFVYNGVKINLTVSIGISTMNSEFNNQKEIVETADKALYNAKQTGRNKVVTYDEQLRIVK